MRFRTRNNSHNHNNNHHNNHCCENNWENNDRLEFFRNGLIGSSDCNSERRIFKRKFSNLRPNAQDLLKNSVRGCHTHPSICPSVHEEYMKIYSKNCHMLCRGEILQFHVVDKFTATNKLNELLHSVMNPITDSGILSGKDGNYQIKAKLKFLPPGSCFQLAIKTENGIRRLRGSEGVVDEHGNLELCAVQCLNSTESAHVIYTGCQKIPIPSHSCSSLEVRTLLPHHE